MRHPNLRKKAALLHALGHPTRLAILEELAEGAKCVTDIRDLLKVPQPNISQHLTILRHERLVDFHEDGKLRCYYVTRPQLVRDLFHFLSNEYEVVIRSAESVRLEGKRREKKLVASGKR